MATELVRSGILSGADCSVAEEERRIPEKKKSDKVFVHENEFNGSKEK
jgi:hypothetical protein